MHAILTPVGSAGDVNPFVMLGRELRARGHGVTVMAPDVFTGAIVRAGLSFASTGTADEYERVTRDPDLWDPRRGTAVVFNEVLGHLRQSYAILERLYEPGETILVGHSLSFFTRVFEEKHGVPAATVHLAPTVFRSDFQQSILPSGHDISRWPRCAKRTLWWAIDRLAIDRMLAPELNAWRHELGLPSVSRVFKSWVHSPQLVLGLFPEWFAEPQPDWPPQLRLTGFVLSDETCAPSDDNDASRRVSSIPADAPIVFTPGSANRHAASFFAAAIDATAQVGRRAVLVTPYREQLPQMLPPHVCHISYAPFSTLFPRAAAVVHHGGVGTCAQGLGAGVPQLVVPMGFDQPDNAVRLQRLNVARVVPSARFDVRKATAALETLLSNTEIHAACQHYSERMKSSDALARTCDLVEQRFTK